VKHQAEIIAVEIMPDQVQVRIEVHPQFGIHRLVENRRWASHLAARILELAI
jgi:REP element-mobilizing transposase RayT